MILNIGFAQDFDIAVKLLSETGISTLEIRYLNEAFISEIKAQTKLKVMERALMDEVLQEQNYNSECSTDECQVQIGRMLAVRKMIFVVLNAKAESINFMGDIQTRDQKNFMEKKFGWTFEEIKPGEFQRYEAGNQTFRGYIKLTDIETGVTEQQTTIKFAGSMDALLDQGIIKKWINKFYSSINLPIITFTSSLNNIQVFKNEEYWNDLPIQKEELQPGEYKMRFILPGFETVKKTYNIVLGQNIADRIELDQKTKTEAFIKSLILPGYGQWYSSDNTHNNRRVTGTIFAVTYLGSLIGTGLTWSEYFASKTDYNNSVDAYNDQEVMTEIESYRKVMEDNHGVMASAKSTAGLMTGILATVWISSAVEAWLRFPTDYRSSVSFSYDPILNTKRLSVSMKF